MDQLFNFTVEFWHWLIFGLLLIVAEIFVFGAVLLWFGIAAIIVGLAVFAFSLATTPALLMFASLSLLLVLGWQIYRKKYPARKTEHTINRRGEQYVGRHFTLIHDVVNGVGELHVDDTRWKVVSHHDLPAGTKVKVSAVEGTSLRVEPYIS